MIASAKARVRSFRSNSFTISPLHSAFRIPHLEPPPLHILPLLPRHPPPFRVQVLVDRREHCLDFVAPRPCVQRAAQVRMQLFRGVEHRDRGYGAQLAPLEIEPRSPDDLAVGV